MRGEYPNFVVPTLREDEIDLEIYFGPFNKKSLGSWSPFFNYDYSEDGVYEERRYKTAHWKVALIGLLQKKTSVYFAGNQSSLVFFIGEILEPLIRYKLAEKGITLIHSSSVSVSGQGCLVSGIRHTGKTLVMMASLFKGASLLSDDYTFVSGEGDLFCYPKKVNLFLTHFREIEGLKQYWPSLPLTHKFVLYRNHWIRKLTRDYAVLGYQRFLNDLFPSFKIINQAPLKQILILTGKPGGKLSLRENIPSEEAAAKLIANNQWEGEGFQRMMKAHAYGVKKGSAVAWLNEEALSIQKIARLVPTCEITVPDFKEKTVRDYLEMALSLHPPSHNSGN